MKIKKSIIITITILLLLLAVVVGYEIAIRIDNDLDRSNEMSREEVINLVSKDYNNYVLTTKDLSIFTEWTSKVFVKDNVIKKVAKDRCHEYVNYNTDERIDATFPPLIYISSAKDYVQDRYSEMSQKHGVSYYNITDES